MSRADKALRDIYVGECVSGGEEVVVGTVRRINAVDGYFTHPALAPDGLRAAYWGRHGERLDVWLADVQRGHAEPVTDGPGMSCHPAWAPDSRRLVYVHNPSYAAAEDTGGLYSAPRFAPRDIWVLDLDSGVRSCVVRNGLDNERPAWAPDGRRLAYVTTVDATQQIRTMDLDSGHETTVVDNAGLWYRPAWHPSGAVLAFNNKGEGSHYIWQVDAAGRNRQQVTPTPAGGRTIHDHGACWAPDGRTLMFHSDRSGSWGVWLIQADGSGLRRLPIPGLATAGHASWDAAQQFICIDAGRAG